MQGAVSVDTVKEPGVARPGVKIRAVFPSSVDLGGTTVKAYSE